MKSTIHVITPTTTAHFRCGSEEFRQCERPDLGVTHSYLEMGPASIESEFDEALCVPDTVRRAVEAEKAGADAIVINCMGDPGLAACREAVRIPVLGPCQTAVHFASMLGTRFSVVSVLERLRHVFDHIIRGYGLASSYAGFESIDIPVLELGHGSQRVAGAIAEKALKTIMTHHAGAVVLGCTQFMGLADQVTEILRRHQLDVPIIDAMPLTIRVADTLVKCGLSHSKHVYPYPEKKDIAGYKIGNVWQPGVAARPRANTP
jgi:allantoin racemase